MLPTYFLLLLTLDGWMMMKNKRKIKLTISAFSLLMTAIENCEAM
jgi:hypothetical protein